MSIGIIYIISIQVLPELDCGDLIQVGVNATASKKTKSSESVRAADPALAMEYQNQIQSIPVQVNISGLTLEQESP